MSNCAAVEQLPKKMAGSAGLMSAKMSAGVASYPERKTMTIMTLQVSSKAAATQQPYNATARLFLVKACFCLVNEDLKPIA